MKLFYLDNLLLSISLISVDYHNVHASKNRALFNFQDIMCTQQNWEAKLEL